MKTDAIGMLTNGEVTVISAVNDEHMTASMTYRGGNNYALRIKLNIFACRMDKAVLIRTMSVLKSAKNSGQVCSGGHFFVGRDSLACCYCCNDVRILHSANAINLHPMQLHTLHHGRIRTSIGDNERNSGNLVRYDCLSDGTVCVS